jgi:hypothetical protein
LLKEELDSLEQESHQLVEGMEHIKGDLQDQAEIHKQKLAKIHQME